jgi:hypothetical protein
MSRSRLSIFFLATLLLLAGSFGCGPPPAQSGQEPSASASGGLPEITDDIIRERINYAWVNNVQSEKAGDGDPMTWSFDEDEPKEIAVVDKQVNGTKATIVLDIKTRSSARSRNPRELAGQIRTEWELRTGWALRQWEIVDTENISMKYKKLPTPTPPPIPDENRQP